MTCKRPHSKDSESTGPPTPGWELSDSNPSKHAVMSFRATREHHNIASKRVTSRPPKRQHLQQKQLDFIAGKLGSSRASEGLRRTPIVEQDCQVPDLSGKQGRMGVLEEMKN